MKPIPGTTTREPLRIATYAGVLVISLLCQACGGGGGGGGGDGTNPPGGGGEATPASGRLWHNSFATSSTVSSKLSNIGGAASRDFDTNATAVPNSAGTRYAIFDYSFRGGVDTTVVTIKDASSASVVHTASFNGYVRDLRMSPTDASVLLVKWGSSATSTDAELVIVDLASKKILQTLSPSVGAAANWLPDGRYVHIDKAGKLTSGKAGSTVTNNGSLTVVGRTVRAITVDPQGTKLLSTWVIPQDGAIKKDLWISDLTGANLARLTSTDGADRGVWSPDGKFVAFVQQPEVICTGFDCSGSTFKCDLRYVAASLRDVPVGSPNAPAFTVPDNKGAAAILGCDLRGWTS
jgi:Tol biopolymer transport system component